MEDINSKALTSILSSNKTRHKKTARKAHFDTSKNEVRYYAVGEANIFLSPEDLASTRSHKCTRENRKRGKNQHNRSLWSDKVAQEDCKDRDNEKNIDKKSFSNAVESILCQTEEGGVYRVDGECLIKGAKVLKTILDDDQKQLEALNILQSVVEQLQHPNNVLRLVFDVLFDEDVIRKEVFYKWTLAAARQGKDDAIASVSGFFLWLIETEAAGFA